MFYSTAAQIHPRPFDVLLYNSCRCVLWCVQPCPNKEYRHRTSWTLSPPAPREKFSPLFIRLASRFRERPLTTYPAGKTRRCLEFCEGLFFASRIFFRRSFSKPRSQANQKRGLNSSQWGGAKFPRHMMATFFPVWEPKQASNVPKVESTTPKKYKP